MFRTDQASAVSALPTPVSAGTQGYFTNGNPAAAQPATILDADFMNMIMMELINIVEDAGQTPSKTTYNQVLTAIKSMLQTGATNIGVDTGAANAYAVAFTPALDAPVPWAPFWFKVKTTNTGASTLNATGTIEPLLGGAHLALQGGELVAGGNALVYWNSTLNGGNGAYVLIFCSGAPCQVAPGAQSDQAAQLGQVTNVSPVTAVLQSQAIGANGTWTVTASVTAPCDGYVFATGSMNVGAPATPGSFITCALAINGTQVSADSTQYSQYHEGTEAVTKNEQVTAVMTVNSGPTNPGISATFRVALLFIPNP